MYLWPWTLLLVAAAHRAWREVLARRASIDEYRAVRFALASSLPALAVLGGGDRPQHLPGPGAAGFALLLGGAG